MVVCKWTSKGLTGFLDPRSFVHGRSSSNGGLQETNTLHQAVDHLLLVQQSLQRIEALLQVVSLVIEALFNSLEPFVHPFLQFFDPHCQSLPLRSDRVLNYFSYIFNDAHEFLLETYYPRRATLTFVSPLAPP